ncbi:MAG: hypothetical protein ACE360_11260 [Hyphomicrobiales bacterium]
MNGFAGLSGALAFLCIELYPLYKDRKNGGHLYRALFTRFDFVVSFFLFVCFAMILSAVMVMPDLSQSVFPLSWSSLTGFELVKALATGAAANKIMSGKKEISPSDTDDTKLEVTELTTADLLKFWFRR